jgi:hypothetical protein
LKPICADNRSEQRLDARFYRQKHFGSWSFTIPTACIQA